MSVNLVISVCISVIHTWPCLELCNYPSLHLPYTCAFVFSRASGVCRLTPIVSVTHFHAHVKKQSLAPSSLGVGFPALVHLCLLSRHPTPLLLLHISSRQHPLIMYFFPLPGLSDHLRRSSLQAYYPSFVSSTPTNTVTISLWLNKKASTQGRTSLSRDKRVSL